MTEHDVDQALQIPYGAAVDVDGRTVKIGRRISRLRAAYRAGQLDPARIAAYEEIPGWSWQPPAIRRRHAHERTGELPDRIRAWMGVHGVTDASRVPYNATLEVDGQHLRIGRSIDWIRRRYNAGELPPQVAATFEQLPGWNWVPPRQRPPGQQRTG